MRYTVKHATRYSYTDPVPICHNRVHLAPRQTVRQTCRAAPADASIPSRRCVSRRIDYFGNEVDFFSMQEAHEGLTVTADSVVDVLPPSADSRGAARLGTGRRKDSDRHTARTGWPCMHCSLPSPRISAIGRLAELRAD